MAIPSALWMLSGDYSQAFVEDFMEFPPCPICKAGRLLPLSDDHAPFALWICSLPGCAYAISKDPTGDTYYKGTAACQDKEKGEKRWTEYEF
jgi:hypothetical protein